MTRLREESVEIIIQLPNNWSELIANRSAFYRDHNQKQLQNVVIDLLGKVGNESLSAQARGVAFLDLHVALLLLTSFWK